MATKLTQISLQMYTLRSANLPLPEMLKKVREIGYQSVQGGPARGMTKEEQKALMDDLGMEYSTWGGDLFGMDNDPDSYIESCRYFDCDEIMIGTMPTEFRGDYDGYMRGIELMNRVGQKLAKGGVFLSYHNHAQEFRRFANGKRGIDLLYENLDPSGVHFMLDTHWVQAGGGDVIEWIQKCKGRMQYIHVKDYRIASPNCNTILETTDKQFAEIGQGNLPWQLIIDTCLAQGIKSFIVEQDQTYGEDPFDCIKTSYDYLRSCGLK